MSNIAGLVLLALGVAVGHASGAEVTKVVMRYTMAATEMAGLKTPAVDTTYTFYLSKTKARVEMNSLIAIYDLSKDSWVTLYPKFQIYSSGEPGELAREQITGADKKGMFSDLDAISSTVDEETTTDTATIAGYLCTKHVLSMKVRITSLKMEAWVTDSINLNPRLTAAVFSVGMSNGFLGKAYGEAIQKMGGFIVRSVTTTNLAPNAQMTNTLESIEEVTVPDDFFEIPAGYDIYPASEDEK